LKKSNFLIIILVSKPLSHIFEKPPSSLPILHSLTECLADEGRYFNGRFGKMKNMNNPNKHDQRIARMTFASIYPLYLKKIERKGRTKKELHRVIECLTGFNGKMLRVLIKEKATFETFFERTSLNPNARLITGVICGYRVEEIENPLTRKVRYLDKLVDELAKGRKLEKILRGSHG